MKFYWKEGSNWKFALVEKFSLSGQKHHLSTQPAHTRTAESLDAVWDPTQQQTDGIDWY